MVRVFKKPSLDDAIFAAFLLLFLIPVWSVTYPPLQDAPAYLISAQVGHGWNDPVLGPIYREYYEWNPALTTNWATQALLLVLLKLVPPVAALKVLLSLYVLLLPLAARYAFRAMNQEPGPSVLLIFPFLFTMVYQYGFLNFSLGLALFFLIAGYLIRHRLEFRFTTILAVMTFSVLAYLTHLVALAMSVLTLVIVGVWSLVSAAKGRAREHLPGPWRTSNRVLLALLAVLPGLALGTRLVGGSHWLFRNGSWTSALAGAAESVDDLVLLRPMIAVASYQRYLVGLLLVLFMLMLGFILWSKFRAPRFDGRDALVALPVAYTLTFLVACAWLGTDLFLVPRLVLFPYFGLMIWLAAYDYPRRWKRIIRALAATVSLGFVVTTTLAYVRLEPGLTEYVSAANVIPSRATLLALSFDGRGPNLPGCARSYRSLVFLHTHGYIAAETNCLDLSNYQAGRLFFPMIYRSERSPYTHIAPVDTIESLPARVDFEDYPRRTDGRIDFVLTWCMPEENLDPNTKFVKEQLQRGFVEVYVSPHRLVRVFRSKTYNP